MPWYQFISIYFCFRKATKAWSAVKPLTKKNISQVPHKKGVYKIGLKEDKKFDPCYLGQSKRSRRNRIAAHARGDGNKGVKNNLDKMYFCHKFVKNPQKFEKSELKKDERRRQSLYTYNKKK